MKYYKIADSAIFNNGKIVIFDCGLYAYIQSSGNRVIIGRKQAVEPSFSEIKPFTLDTHVYNGPFSGTIAQAVIFFIFNYNPKTDMDNFWRIPS